ncbi:carboxymuconolactone decarboxylase family protein [Jatrophihabitans fulvus]
MSENLGGRLPLLAPDELDDDQRELHARLVETRVARGRRSGYRAMLDDGRLIGPFNAMLRAPAVAAAQLAWAEAVSAAGLDARVREIAVLTVGAEYGAAFVVHAHGAAAAGAGIGDDDVRAIVRGADPAGLSPAEHLAHRLARALVRERAVDDDLYGEVVATFGERDTVVLVQLIGQYLATSALLTCFDVPAPQA